MTVVKLYSFFFHYKFLFVQEVYCFRSQADAIDETFLFRRHNVRKYSSKHISQNLGYKLVFEVGQGY